MRASLDRVRIGSASGAPNARVAARVQAQQDVLPRSAGTHHLLDAWHLGMIDESRGHYDDERGTQGLLAHLGELFWTGGRIASAKCLAIKSPQGVAGLAAHEKEPIGTQLAMVRCPQGGFKCERKRGFVRGWLDQLGVRGPCGELSCASMGPSYGVPARPQSMRFSCNVGYVDR